MTSRASLLRLLSTTVLVVRIMYGCANVDTIIIIIIIIIIIVIVIIMSRALLLNY